MQPPPDHLGSFYLGAEYDLQNETRTNVPLNYEARDLTTHALCVGMTGSGKSGLCLGLMEEAALDDVPAILIDPKGDIANLVLQFPDLSPGDFAPWISQDDARREGKSVADYAADVAAGWKRGIEDWGMSLKRVQSLKESAEYTIYTPGSEAGVPINILGSLAAPGLSFDDFAEIIRERISGTVNALLSLVGIAADPIQSREAILLAAIFEHFWRRNQDLDLTKLILSIQNPPVRQLGVLDVDTFFPEKERFELSMAFNNLLAAPTFQNWLEGETLDIDALLYTESGVPRHSIFYIAHLSAQERMFFVTLMLESLLGWVRRQAGTRSLRAILYFDEVYGYLPPVAQPPSKRPMMALLKQSRAVGLGCILATQNPADVDYKALANTGTWFIGRLQTGRDRARVIDGLKGAIAESGGDSGQVDYEQVISQLGSRVFLMHNVHDDAPVVFQTRWVMSYLHGPLTRPQIRELMGGHKDQVQASDEQASARPSLAAVSEPTVGMPTAPSGLSRNRPIMPPDIPQFFLPVTKDETEIAAQLAQGPYRAGRIEGAQLAYEPAIIGAARVRFFDRQHGISEQRERLLLAQAPDRLGAIDWAHSQALAIPLSDLRQEPAQVAPEQGPFFAPVPEEVNSTTELKRIARGFADWLYFGSELTLLAHPELKVLQQPDETQGQFKARLRQAARERRDEEVDKLRKAYAARIEKLEDKLRKEERELDQDQADYGARKREVLVASGEMLLTLLRRRRVYRTVSWTASRRRLAEKAKMDVQESREEIEDLEAGLSELREELEEEIRRITPRWPDILKALRPHTLHPRRSDIEVITVGLAWVPSWAFSYSDGGQSLSTSWPAY